MEIRVYARLSPEHLWETGKRAGLSDKAADYFRYFEEVPLIFAVDDETGSVVRCNVDPSFQEKLG